MKKILTRLTAFILVLSAIQGCNKEKTIENYAFSKVRVLSTNFVDVPEISVYLNDAAMGEITPGGFKDKMIAIDGKPVTLSIKDRATGDLLIDTSFIPTSLHYDFKVLVDNTLGIRQFIAAAEADPVDEDHWRVQLLHKISKNGVEKRVLFKLFVDEDGSATTFTELPVSIEPVAYGQLSQEFDIPVIKYPPGPLSGYFKDIYIKAFDASTNELLVDIAPYNALNWLFPAPATRYVVPLPTIEDPGTATLSWDYFWEVYQL